MTLVWSGKKCHIIDIKQFVTIFDRHNIPWHINVTSYIPFQLMGTDYKFDLMLSEDGSGRGACMVAAVLKSGGHMCCRNMKMEE